MNIHEFKAKWQSRQLKERSASQEHFIDLCHALGKPTPGDLDRTGDSYTFERGVTKTGGGKGFADVWLRGKFAWEYKGLDANLEDAYTQLLQYREDLESPPLLVVCDLNRFEIHTQFYGMSKHVYRFDLSTIDLPENLRVLRALWEDPERLRPQRTVEDVTEEAAQRFGRLARQMAERDIQPERAAHFLVQMLFCLFSEDVGLLPKGLFGKLLTFSASSPEHFTREIENLFVAMRDGGVAGYETINRFNGGLFETIDVVELTGAELEELARASQLDWTSIEPAIIGTLFERSLDPARRSQLGAHYTGRADIERVVEPVVMTPLRRRWDAVREEADAMKAKWDAALERQRERQSARPTVRPSTAPAVPREVGQFQAILMDFQAELTQVTVLDPACGSGNFLYVALNALLDLEKEVVTYGLANGLPAMFPLVRPTQLYGLEINQYAQELTQVVIWIGYLQWMTANGFQPRRDPVLGEMDNIKLQDSLLDRSDPDHPREATWPPATSIIGNPPFLGQSKLRIELGDSYVDDLFHVFQGRIPGGSDLCCYFFEKAREYIASGCSHRAGMLANYSIRYGGSRRVLERIKQTGDIFMAWSNQAWILEGAAVRISIVGFDDGTDENRYLDGQPVQTINADLSATVDVTVAKPLPGRSDLAFEGVKKAGPFDIPEAVAMEMISLPPNVNGRPNSDVVRLLINAFDVTRRPRNRWIIDFGAEMSLDEAAQYEAPFEYVRENVLPVRMKNRDERSRNHWWIHQRPRPEMRNAIKDLPRFIATPRVSKHRLFVWLPATAIPDSRLFVFARDDDYFFGVLHSKAHEVWSLRAGAEHGAGNDPTYNVRACFETFPFPRPDDEQQAAIAGAAKRLDELRKRSLNPEGASEADLKKRTLTNLYNQRPTWLDNAHLALDRAVWAAYTWPEDPTETDDETILRRLLELNLERSASP